MLNLSPRRLKTLLNNPIIMAMGCVLGGFLLMTVGPLLVLTEGLMRAIAQITKR